ncbi:VRR-NUC domain-containing protein [Oenococcus sicerae]|uniref:VRR-NUC domain-containing protein n=1 Tax=Oenococcus sicerae TaxID=2203724 RepID=A0AAJ1RAW3_9LACO|nr:VRR-NUC domain-containing protein [Oenococcus sicerae]MDN6899550.1 VRR-NUC domain-containing protein [Oenococcus sicerae]
MSEHSIQDEVRVALSKHGYTVWRINVGQGYTKQGNYFSTGVEKGFPDLMGYNPATGKIFFIEMKSATGKPRPEQIQHHIKYKHDHIIHGIARSVDDALKIVQGELCGYGFEKYDKED